MPTHVFPLRGINVGGHNWSPVFVRTPDGMGRSQLVVQLTRRGGAGATATARNCATVTRLPALLGP